MKSIFYLVGCLAITVAVGTQGFAQSATQQQTEALVSEFIKTGVDRKKVNQLFRDSTLADGSVEPLLNWLRQSRTDLATPRDRVIAEIEVHLASQRGDLRRASNTLNSLLDQQDVRDARSDLVIWQAKLHDALGDVAKAKEIYQELTKRELQKADQQSVRLRLALMGLIGDPANKTKADAKPLIELASQDKDTEFRNRAANVLAVQNQHKEAIKLFTIQGEGTERFRSASRVAEWAIRASDRDKAIEAAWDAVNSSELKRDRNYALALLVEAHRLKEKKKGLEALVKEFEKRNQSEKPMPAEMRSVWVNLLRELGKYDDAIKLFKTTAENANGFSVEIRRELLEMESEAGNEDRMIESYRDLIASEPDELTWRAGLTQVLLEKGQEDKATELWINYVSKLERGSLLFRSAQTLGEFGLDDLAEKTIDRMVQLRIDHGQALLYWADLQQRRGNVEVAESILNRIQKLEDVGDDVRAELASAYERIGRQDKAIQVNEAIRANRKTVAEDLEMRLAWLYSEIGDEERALEQWQALWKKVTSIPRRRYVEDRLMTVASRLGTLADIAIELEEKLADGTADDREAGLLVRIYSRVNDSVAATEISEEYMSKTGKNQVEQLQEKGRIYQVCNDYWNYEKVIEKLIAADPEGKTEYLRQLALSMLERGKAQEARKVLMTLRNADDGKDTIGGEFEAGVLSLVGMNAEAVDAYRKGIARYPDRIESYLLLANLLKEMGQVERAVGMFQYLAENAERDDLFTIAIDGLLNMEAKGNAMQWARRITLERLAGREDKNYLYQLLADLSAEVNDKQGQIRAMENSLAVSGTRRLSVLRECMELSSKIRGGVYYSSSSRGPTNKGNMPFFAYGRRLIGLGELMPPQVFLDLGQAFLADGDTPSAERTFGMARNLADPRSYQREVAEIFEKAGKLPEALVRYEKLLRTSPSNVPLMARVAKLNEQEGNDAIAFRFYQRALDLLIAQTPLTTQEEKKGQVSYWSSNRDAYQTYSQQLLTGILVTVPDDQVAPMFQEQLQSLEQSLKQLETVAETGRTAERLADSPRIEKRTESMRKMQFAFDRIADVESMDLLLIKKFPEDKDLVAQLARQRIQRGRYDSVRRLLETAKPNDKQKTSLLMMLGDSSSESETSTLSPKEMWQRFLPVWMKGDVQQARKILRRVDRNKGRAPGARPSYVIVNGMAVMQNSGSASDVGAWMRLALSLGDEGLALQFARSRLKSSSRYTVGGIKRAIETYESILPEEQYADLVRYAANLYKEDKDRIADYLWLIANKRDLLNDDIPSDKKLLEMVEDSSLQINYYFPFQMAMESFPDSIRAEALTHTIDGIDKKSRPRELVRIPFMAKTPIDESTGKVIVDAIKSGIEPAMQDNYLRYCSYYLPRAGTACACKENSDLAISVLDLLQEDRVRKREDVIPKMAEYIKAVVLHQSDRTEEALKIVLASYDPEENITDYYARYSRDWAHRELVPVAADRFADVIAGKVEKGKPTTKQTDQRLKLILKTKDDQRIRAAYKRAIKHHPAELKFVTAYERWEKGKQRNSIVIDLAEQRLSELKKSTDAAKSTEREKIHKRLAQLWFSVNHPVKGLMHWKVADDKDKAKFDTELTQREKEQAKTPSQPEPKSDKPSVAPKAKPKSKTANTTKKKYAASMSGVKKAITDKDLKSASQTLRKVWRSFPPAVASPYGYRTSTKRVSGLTWPADPVKKVESASKTTNPDSTAEDKKRAEAKKKRNRLRGGLATFLPEQRPPKPKQQNAWKVLASYPFAVAEMNRLLRSRTSPSLSKYNDIILGLLHARREELGDEAVFTSIVNQIQSGYLSDSVLAQAFAMLDEDHSRINQENELVVDTLLDRLDLTDSKRASQLAELCAKIGQRERAKALYRHCAILTASSPNAFSGLIDKARKTFNGEELVNLAESMYELTNQDASATTEILELRMEFLNAAIAGQRSETSFGGDIEVSDTVELSQAVNATRVFSRATKFDLAKKNFSAVIRAHGKPRILRSSYSYYPTSSTSKIAVGRDKLIAMLPPIASIEDERWTSRGDYEKWLASAADAIRVLIEEDDSEPEILVESLLIVSLRQCELNRHKKAVETLKLLTDEMLTEATKHESLAMDVLRLAGATEQAWQLQSRLHSESRLTHVRFGDFLRDTARVHGAEKATQLLEELAEKSLDRDLMDAAHDIAHESDLMRSRVKQLHDALTLANKEHKDRLAAAQQRQKTRQEWKKQPTAVRP